MKNKEEIQLEDWELEDRRQFAKLTKIYKEELNGLIIQKEEDSKKS